MPGRLLIATLLMMASMQLSAADTCEIPFVRISLDDEGMVIVRASLNGSEPIPFLLDTGASHSVVSGALANRLHLTAVAKTEVMTSTGREVRPVVKIDTASIGSKAVEALLASVVPQVQLTAIKPGVEGIIGQDFLSGFNYTLDYLRKRLSWHIRLRDQDTGSRLPLISRGGRYLVRMSGGRHDGGSVLLVPDSGATGFVVYARNGLTKLPLEPAHGLTVVRSLSAGQTARTLVLRELVLGAATLRDQPVAVVDRSATDPSEGDGLLPLHIFASVSFSASESSIIFRAR
jgi:predicted aspartyl protease